MVEITEYERLIERLELRRDIQIAERQIAEGEGVPHAEAKQRILSRLRTSSGRP